MTIRLSIIIPVYREQKIIQETLARLCVLSLPGDFEIIVSDGEPGGGTIREIPDSALATGRVRTTLSSRGRGPQMNQGAAVSHGDILLFLHADTRIDQEHLDIIDATCPSLPCHPACGAFDLAIDRRTPAFVLIQTIASWRSRLTGIPYGDQGIFMTRDLFDAIGGYPDIPIMEDVAIMGSMKKAGIKPRIHAHRVTTSSRRWDSQGIVATTFRNWMLILLFQLGVKPERLEKVY